MTNRIIKSAAFMLLMFILLFASIGYPQNENKHDAAYLSDSAVTKEVINNFSKNVFYGIFDWVTINSKEGVVTLGGWVHYPWLKSELQEAAEKAPGVKSVDNKIQYTFGPGRMGVRAASLIYNDPLFIGQANSVNPPVHIIVNNDIVLLEGRVGSEQQKEWATYLVQNFTNAFTVKNELKVMKPRNSKNI